MAGHGGADEAIALALLVLRAPLLAQLVRVLHALHLLTRQLTLVPLAAAAGCLSDARSGAFAVLSFFFHHVALLSLLQGGE